MTVGWSREEIAQRTARDVPAGSYVNIGIGLPELLAGVLAATRGVLVHTENGLLGVGPTLSQRDGDPDLVNAGKRRVTAVSGASYFHHADSFAMIRGGHIDICVLGAMQVAENGDLANWSAGATDAVPSVGGAMDLVAGVRTVFVMTSHCAKDGTPKLLRRCTYPLTGAGVVDRIFTDLGVFDVGPAGFEVVELAPNVTQEYVQKRTAAPLAWSKSARRART